MNRILENEYIEYIKDNNVEELKKVIPLCHPADIVEILNNVNSKTQFELFEIIPPDIASEFIVDLNQDVLENILFHLNKQDLIEIIDEMDTDEATDILNDVEDTLANQVLNAINDKESNDIKELLKYDEESAGGIMQTEIFSVCENETVAELIEIIKQHSEVVENAHHVFVTDENKKLTGYLNLVDLLINSNDKIAKELIKEDVITVHVDLDQEEVAHTFRKYDLYVIPVVDDNNVLLGRITADDIIDIIDDEASEDAYKMVGLENEDRVFTSPLKSVKHPNFDGYYPRYCNG